MKMKKILTAMCVAGFLAAGPAWAGYRDNGDGTVNDDATKLMWQQQNDAITRTWVNALAYCEGLGLAGHTDWRLPNYKELESIVDTSRYNPAIDTVAFPNTISSLYWSSTTFADGANLAWIVYFGSGYVGYDNKNYSYDVRCVRGGQ